MGSGFRLHPEVAWRQVDGVVFLLTPDSRFHQSDDPVGRCVWDAIATAAPSSPPDEEALVRHLTSRFDVDAATAAEDLHEYLDQLLSVGAIERIAGTE